MVSTTNFLPKGGMAVDPEHLESLGKQAARMAETAELSLNDAVVETIGHEKLNSEQVRRVVEFANVEAFNRKFAAMEGPMRAVHIDGGPADPAHVIQTLAAGAQPRSVEIDAMEFSMPPSIGKISSIDAGHVYSDRTQKGVMMEVMALQSKLSAAHEEVVASLEAAKHEMNETLVDLADRTRSVTVQGASAGEVFDAWSRVDPELAKVAFARVRGVLPEGTKVAGDRRINPAHPVVTTFDAFVKAAQAYGSHESARQAIEAEMVRVSEWLSKNGV